MDHIGSNEQFDVFYMHPDEEPHYRSQNKPGRLLPILDGDEIDLGGRKTDFIVLSSIFWRWIFQLRCYKIEFDFRSCKSISN